ncbi:MAG: hypothetical protein WCR72_16510 [Bacteroidota bacterium]
MSSFSRFINNIADGKLGTVGVDTNIKVDNQSLVNVGLSLFLAGVLVVLAYFALRKVLSS